jgi:DNA-binding transcriptional LysR family regulator
MTTAMQWNDRIRRRVKLRDVDVLLTVIRTGSMGKAASALNMSQPAVSKAIAELEHTLGVRLLDRSRQGVEATAYGRALVRRGTAMFDELRQGVEDIASLTDPTSGEVRAGGSDTMISAVFSPVLQRLLQKNPKMSSLVITGDFRMLARDLEARQIDVVISRLYGPPSHEYSVEILFEDPLVVVCGSSNALSRRRKVALADLIDQPWTLQPEDNTFGAVAINALRAAGVVLPRLTVATTSSTLRGELLATGRYLTVVPRFSVLLPRPDPGLRMLPVELPQARHRVAIVTLKDRSLTPATRLFIDDVRAITKPLARLA